MTDFKTAGIVAEFNPFHQGHSRLIERTREDLGVEGIVAVISGSFVQRGEPAVYNKWKRAEMALAGGVDLVLELPAVYSTAGAGYFAKGSVEILEALGNLDYLAFGSESGDVSKLSAVADFLKEKDQELAGYVKAMKKEGVSFPAAREAFLRDHLGSLADILAEPNNILAVEYLKNLDKMKAYTLQRETGDHLKSASELRRLMRYKEGSRLKVMEERYFLLVRNKILTSTAQDLAEAPDGSFDLAMKAKGGVRYAQSLEDLILRIKSKEETYSRVSRFLAQAVLNMKKEAAAEGATYIKVLAFNERGRAILKDAKKRETLTAPVIDNINREIYRFPQVKETLETDILATDIYNMLEGADMYENSDYVKKPVFQGLQPL